MSVVIQFRKDDAEVEFLRQQGFNPNEFGSMAFDEALRFARASARAKTIAEIRRRLPKDIGRDVVASIREDRDTDHGRA